MRSSRAERPAEPEQYDSRQDATRALNQSSSERFGRSRVVARYALAGVLITAGTGHLSWARTAFRAQVPAWVPGEIDTIVVLSGAVEIALGISLVFVRSKWTGRVVAAFFVAVFPGNIAQFVGHKDAFGLDTDTRRAVRLLLQPVLVAWALWSTWRPFSRDDSRVAATRASAATCQR